MPGRAGSNHKGNEAEKERMHYANAHVLYQRKILPRPFWLLFAETKPLLNSVQKLLFQQRVDEYIHQFTAMPLNISHITRKIRNIFFANQVLNFGNTQRISLKQVLKMIWILLCNKGPY